MRDITIAIHHREASYSHKWIEYCKMHGINYKLVNCYANDIIGQLQDCDALMWNWSHSDYRAGLFAKQLVQALDRDGFRVFPDAKTSWFFDDKVGQKYLLEKINAPLVKSYVFYDKKSALEWIEATTFPKVFKLRNGAGAHNVQLIKTKSKAKKYIKQAFSCGFVANRRTAVLMDRIWHFKRDKSLKSFFNISKGLYRYLFPHKKNTLLPVEKNYIYAQDFIPNCDHDIRVFVIGNRAVTKKRYVREGDFRASGSGKFTFDIEAIDRKCVEIAFDIVDKLGVQSLAFDFVKDVDGYKIVEICYAASAKGFPECPGYWKRDLTWVKTPLRVEFFMIEDMINQLKKDREESIGL